MVWPVGGWAVILLWRIAGRARIRHRGPACDGPELLTCTIARTSYFCPRRHQSGAVLGVDSVLTPLVLAIGLSAAAGRLLFIFDIDVTCGTGSVSCCSLNTRIRTHVGANRRGNKNVLQRQVNRFKLSLHFKGVRISGSLATDARSASAADAGGPLRFFSEADEIP